MQTKKRNRVSCPQGQHQIILPKTLKTLPCGLKYKTQSKSLKNSFSFLTERPQNQNDRQQQEQNEDYSEQFRQIINKVLNRICKKNEFIKSKLRKEKEYYSVGKCQSPRDIYHYSSWDMASFESPSKQQKFTPLNKSRTIYKQNNSYACNKPSPSTPTSKLRIKGVGRQEQNQSNLLKKPQVRPKIFSKTPVSFMRKSISHQRSKTLSSEMERTFNKEKTPNASQKNQPTLCTFYRNAKYSQSQFSNTQNKFFSQLDPSIVVASLVPKLAEREQFQKINQLFRQTQTPKQKTSINLNFKLLKNKIQRKDKMVKNFFKHSQNNNAIENDDQQRQFFQPWNTHQQNSAEQLFLTIKRNHH